MKFTGLLYPPRQIQHMSYNNECKTLLSQLQDSYTKTGTMFDTMQRAIHSAKEEASANEKWREMHKASEKERLELKQESGDLRQKLSNAIKIKEMFEDKLCTVSAERDGLLKQTAALSSKSGLADLTAEKERLKQQLEDRRTRRLPVVDMTQDQTLARNLMHTFTMVDGFEEETDENMLYSTFIDNLPQEEQENAVRSMFSICNNRKRIQGREIQMFRS
jgi:hypothetical protein